MSTVNALTSALIERKTSFGRFVTAGLALFTVASANAQFYGGDLNSQGLVASEINTNFQEFLAYDNFAVSGAPWMVTGVFANFLTNTTTGSFYYEIRSGMSAGNGGTLLQSGTVAAAVCGAVESSRSLSPS